MIFFIKANLKFHSGSIHAFNAKNSLFLKGFKWERKTNIMKNRDSAGKLFYRENVDGSKDIALEMNVDKPS